MRTETKKWGFPQPTKMHQHVRSSEPIGKPNRKYQILVWIYVGNPNFQFGSEKLKPHRAGTILLKYQMRWQYVPHYPTWILVPWFRKLLTTRFSSIFSFLPTRTKTSPSMAAREKTEPQTSKSSESYLPNNYTTTNFYESPDYSASLVIGRFRVTLPIYDRIVSFLTNYDTFFKQKKDCTNL